MSAKDHVHEPPQPGQPCPCGTGKTFGVCCSPILKQERKAASPTELMRSRFTAHVVFDWEHLHRSCLETSTQPYEKQPQEGHTHWTRLTIHEEAPGAKPETATVDFTAYFVENDVERAFHEKAEFLKQADGWIYVKPLRQGPAPIRGGQPKAGRNDPCPCGSGRKFKSCCLK